MPALTLTDPLTLGLLTLVALIAGLVRGFTGFGGPAVMILVLIPFFAPISVLPKVLVIDFVANLKLLPSTIREVDRQVAVPLVLASLLGLPLGIYALQSVDPLIMKRVIAGVALLCVVLMLVGGRLARVPPRWAHIVVGLLAGVTLGATVIAFVVVLYLFASPASAAVSRANAIVWGFATSVVLIAIHVASANIGLHDIWRAALIGFVYLAGTTAGAWAFRRASERNFRTAVLWLMLLLATTGLVV